MWEEDGTLLLSHGLSSNRRFQKANMSWLYLSEEPSRVHQVKVSPRLLLRNTVQVFPTNSGEADPSRGEPIT